MKRFWILFTADIKTWRKNPMATMAGFLPAIMMLFTFGLLFGGKTAFPVAVVNHDSGAYGELLIETMSEVESPLGGAYYAPMELSEDKAWEKYDTFAIDTVWVIPADFSQRLLAGDQPKIEEYFHNYNDDRAKNHRIYPTEILWRFYEKVDEAEPDLALAAPPLLLREEYPAADIVGWFPLVGVAVALLGAMLAGMINIFSLTQQEQVAGITTDIGLAPRSLNLFLLSKLVFSLMMALISATIVLVILYFWIGVSAGVYMWGVWLLAGLVALFWAGLALILSFMAGQALGGGIVIVAAGLIIFFIAGGMAPVQYLPGNIWWLIQFFPNTYAVDPIRELVLFNTIPTNWIQTVVTLVLFAAVSLGVGFFVAQRQLRKSVAR
jgi:ABC-type polysaccharide/polyol phosphate export permease